MLPSVLERAAILAAVCLAAAGMALFCARLFSGDTAVMQKLHIGYVAQEDAMTRLAVSYVQEMGSVKSLCSLEPVTEQEGRALLEAGELSGLVVLPEDMMDEILSGSNAPARLYLPDSGGVPSGGPAVVAGMLFEELASAGMGMLGTAQAEIYAAGPILGELMARSGDDIRVDGQAVLQEMYDDINRFNLGVVTGREALFRTQDLSLTGNEPFAVYYGSALLTVYGMLAGLFFGRFCKRAHIQQTLAARRLGIPYGLQLAARCMAGWLLMFTVSLLPLLLLLFLGDALSIVWSVPGIVGFLLVTMFLTVYAMFLYEIVERQGSAVVAAGILAVFQAYMSGCLIPSVLLPQAISRAGSLLPASYVKAGFTILFTGEARELARVAAGLVVWGAVLFGLTWISMQAGERDRGLHAAGQKAGRDRVPSVVMVLFRRLMHKKSIWLCMGLVVLLSAAIKGAEKGSETQIRAAVYDASGEHADLLEAYGGLVSFVRCDSREQVVRAVLGGDVECGYLLPEDLTGRMIARRANNAITVLQDADAVAVPVVNEILFERLFRRVSLEWFRDYLAQNETIAELGGDREWLAHRVDECFEQQLDATFCFEIERIGSRAASAPQSSGTAYPAFIVAASAVVLCALQGIAQVCSDIRGKRFYKRNRAVMSALTILLPVLLGLAAAVLTMGLVRCL